MIKLRIYRVPDSLNAEQTVYMPYTIKSIRATGYRCLNEPDTQFWPSILVTCLIALVIVLNVIEVILNTVEGFSANFGESLIYITYGFALFFSVEYFLRVWVAADTPHEKSMSDWHKRWKYMLSSMGLVDLLSSLPLFIWVLLPTEEWADFRILKLIAMVRVLKLTRYSSSLSSLAQVYRENQHTLFAAVLVMMILMILAAAGIYVFERHVQPESFGSIPDSMWWAFVTLTTVGYGDVVPMTLGGKVFGAMVMVCGVGVAAMPAGIFASSFVQLVREQEKERRFQSRFKYKSANMAGKSLANELSHFHLSMSEQREVNYLMEEFGLSLEQAVGVVNHFRHAL